METVVDTTSLIEKDRKYIWHPFTQMKNASHPIPLCRAKGAYLYAEDGKRYIDAISSWWVNLHGHTHPYIASKISMQAEILEHAIFADFTHAPAVELASRLISLLPGPMSKVFFSDNGSTAVEVALKIALQYWHNKKNPKTNVVSFRQSYHGDTFGAMSAAGRNDFNKPFWNHLFTVDNIDPPVVGMEGVALQQLLSIIRRGDTACFIFEPLILGSGGMIIYPSEGLDKLIKCCQEHNVLTIADEVMTGFGRTDTLFASEQLTYKPDFICLSKGLTGGFLPLGVTACTEELFTAFLDNSLSHAFLHGHSYTANPLACSSALASLDLLLEDSCHRQRKMISKSHRNFCDQCNGHPRLVRCESIGTILALEYRTEISSYFSPLRDRLYRFFLDKGILLRPLGNVVYVMPPYCIEKGDLDFIYSIILETL